MNTEDHDELWHLLGKARQPAVSPFFSRNVLREIRSTQQERRLGFFEWLRKRRQTVGLAFCILALIGGSFAFEKKREETQLLTMAKRVTDSPDYQVIAHLDELLDTEENTIWLEASNY